MTIIYAPSDAALAERIENDFRGQLESVVVLLVSPEANNHPQVQSALNAALDANRRVIPVLVRPAALPRPVEHLAALDFTAGYAADQLRAGLERAASDFHMKVLTPAVRSSNRRTGLIFGLMALVMFLMGLYLVGVVGIRFPEREYGLVETEIILTRDYFIDQALPRTTEEAANFQATVDAARPTLRPLLVATATAVAGEAAAAE